MTFVPHPSPSHPAIETLGIDDLIAMEIPTREMLLDPILSAKGLIGADTSQQTLLTTPQQHA